MNSNVSPENIQTLVHGATPLQIIIMLFLGFIVLGMTIWIVRWIIEMKVGTLPQDIKEIKAALTENSIKMSQLEAKLWNADDMGREIDSRINHHAATCPARNKCGNMNK